MRFRLRAGPPTPSRPPSLPTLNPPVRIRSRSIRQDTAITVRRGTLVSQAPRVHQVLPSSARRQRPEVPIRGGPGDQDWDRDSGLISQVQLVIAKEVEVEVEVGGVVAVGTGTTCCGNEGGAVRRREGTTARDAHCPPLPSLPTRGAEKGGRCICGTEAPPTSPQARASDQEWDQGWDRGWDRGWDQGSLAVGGSEGGRGVPWTRALHAASAPKGVPGVGDSDPVIAIASAELL